MIKPVPKVQTALEQSAWEEFSRRVRYRAMKRSDINRIITDAEDFFSCCQFHLPAWAGWTPDMWEQFGSHCTRIFTCQLGWDITDFGSDNFVERGLVIFTLRNGLPGQALEGYAEKIMIVREEQETPLHFHWKKREDIINRGGGVLVFEVYNRSQGESLSSAPLTIYVDSLPREIKAGVPFELAPGESITIEPFVWHRFYGRRGAGKVLVGEVSSLSDDCSDNCFFDSPRRFPDIEEDEPAYRLLVGDYAALSISLIPVNRDQGGS
jgi:D-lyxose ketol-isomerase